MSNIEIDQHELFIQRCFTWKFEHHDKYVPLIDQLLLISKNNLLDIKEETQTNVYAWRSRWKLHQDFPIMNELCNELTQVSKQIIKGEGVKNWDDLDVCYCWINIFKKDDYAVPHIHNVHNWSLVYFYKMPKNSSSLTFHNPYGITVKTDKREYSPTIDIKAQEGTVIFFPGWVHHSVDKNQSEEDRITIAINFEDKFKNNV